MTYSHSEEIKMLRVVLTKTDSFPTREELCTSERAVGEKFFEDIELDWAGYIVLDDMFNLSAQWLARIEDQEAILNRVDHLELVDHKINVFVIDEEETEELMLI